MRTVTIWVGNDRVRASKSAFVKYLQETPGWWHDPKWGVHPDRFLAWAHASWRSHKGKRRKRPLEYNIGPEAVARSIAISKKLRNPRKKA